MEVLQIPLYKEWKVLLAPAPFSYLQMNEPPRLIQVGMYMNKKKGVSLGKSTNAVDQTSPIARAADQIIPSEWGPLTCPSVGQFVNPSLDVLEKTEKDHVVDPGPDEDDGEAFVHAGLGDCHRGLADLLGLSEQHALRSGLAGVEGVSL